MSSTYKSNVAAVKRAIKAAEKQSLSQIGELVEREARERAPYDESNTDPEHIHLRDSIKAEVKGNRVVIGIEDNSTFSGSDKYYARFQEFGTLNMPAANNDKGYLRPAAEENVNEIVGITKRNIGEVGK